MQHKSCVLTKKTSVPFEGRARSDIAEHTLQTVSDVHTGTEHLSFSNLCNLFLPPFFSDLYTYITPSIRLIDFSNGVWRRSDCLVNMYAVGSTRHG